MHMYKVQYRKGYALCEVAGECGEGSPTAPFCGFFQGLLVK